MQKKALGQLCSMKTAPRQQRSEASSSAAQIANSRLSQLAVCNTLGILLLNTQGESRRVTPSDEPFPVGATVELHGLHPAIILNGRHVVVVPTPLDVAARGRINVVLDGAVYAIHRENLRAVATP